MNLLLRFGLRHHRRHPLQTLLTLLGIAAGVALLVAMQSSQATAERAFDAALATVAGDATHTVTAGPAGVPVAHYAALARELGGRHAAPSVHAIARAMQRPERTVLRVLGIDPLADASLRPWAAAGSRGTVPFPLAALMAQPGTFVATPALRTRLGLADGDELPITVGGRPFRARCVGALAVDGALAAGLDDVLLVDIATAQEWTGRQDRIDRIDLRLDAANTQHALAAVRTCLGTAARIEAVGARQGGLAQLARGFRVNLTALSLLSLLVGAFLVHETMRLSVVARRPQFGVLRALGVASRSLGIAVAAEAAMLGLLGSGLGALLGLGAAQLLLAPLVRTLNDHYATFSLHGVVFEPGLLLLGTALGGGVAVLAGLGPAVAASRVTARSVLVPARAAAASPASPWRALRWILPPALVAVLLLTTCEDRLLQAYFGMLALVVAAVAAVPPALAACLAAAARVARPAGPFVRYVVRSTLAARDHLALPMAAMVLAVGTTIGLATLVGSFRDSVAGWLGQVLPGDVFVSVPGGVDERTLAFAPAVASALEATPGVVATTAYYRSVLPVRGGTRQGAADLDVVGVRASARFVRGFPLLAGDDERGRGALSRDDGAWVSEPLAFRFGLAVGDVLTVATARGDVPLPIAAIYRDYSNERGEVIVGATWFAAHVGTGSTAFGFEVAADTTPEAVADAMRVRSAAAADQAISVQVQRALRESSLAIFDRTFAITGVMRLLCLAVAFFGIYAAFAAMQYERGAEIGLLRCLGASPSRIGLVVIGQTALLGLCAGVLAVPLGGLFGHVLADVVNRVSFGWTLVEVAMPWRAAGEAVLLAIAAAVLAGLQPAWRFSHMRPAAALRES